jgi:hypothetical protein
MLPSSRRAVSERMLSVAPLQVHVMLLLCMQLSGVGVAAAASATVTHSPRQPFKVPVLLTHCAHALCEEVPTRCGVWRAVGFELVIYCVLVSAKHNAKLQGMGAPCWLQLHARFMCLWRALQGCWLPSKCMHVYLPLYPSPSLPSFTDGCAFSDC